MCGQSCGASWNELEPFDHLALQILKVSDFFSSRLAVAEGLMHWLALSLGIDRRVGQEGYHVLMA
jgi:hypothetical protein